MRGGPVALGADGQDGYCQYDDAAGQEDPPVDGRLAGEVLQPSEDGAVRNENRYDEGYPPAG
ncbi:MAG: hypothetical protein LBL33_01780 [Tannerella sp.]|nr:hypothetical protein [Tannerella sp.]